jgi:acetyl esterase
MIRVRRTFYWILTLLGMILPGSLFVVGVIPWYLGLSWMAFLGLGFLFVYQKNRLHAQTLRMDGKASIVSLLVISVAAISTHVLQAWMSPLMSSALVALLFAMIWKDAEGDAFLGSFIGMTLLGYGTLPLLLLAALVATAGLILFGPWLHHVGGRGGFLAFLGVWVVFGLFESPLPVVLRTITAIDLLVALFSALATIELKNRFKLSSVQASAGVGLILGIFWISIPSVSSSVWLIGYGATFVAMTTQKIVSDSAAMAASVLYPFVYLSFQPLFVGYGGKLGMTAMLTVLTVCGFIELTQRLKSRDDSAIRVLTRKQIIAMLDPQYRPLAFVRMPHQPVILAIFNWLLGFGVKRVKPMEGVDETVVTIRTRDGKNIAATLFVPKTKTSSGAVVYYPGGGFVMRSTPFHKTTAQRFCQQLGAVVLFVDYRLAPKHPFPSALFDALDALSWLEGEASRLGIDPTNIIVAGDSAGGNLALAVSLWRANHQEAIPRGMMLIYPAADRLDAQGSRSAYWNAPMFSGRDYAMVKRHYYREVPSDWMEYAAPLSSKELAKLPPTYIETAEFDPLHDDGRLLAQALRGEGIAVTDFDLLGAPHGYDAAMTSPMTLSMRKHRLEWLKKQLSN